MGIFEPYRAIGYITSNVPFAVQRLGTETFVTVSVGKAWQIYNVGFFFTCSFISLFYSLCLFLLCYVMANIFSFLLLNIVPKKIMVGPQLPKKIRALASYKDYTFAAYGTNIGVFKRAHQVCIQKRINLWHE
ncbi:hypothetical protein B296_00034920 [Ensete ventricosum]|uniref:Uncharacterized protein n=1 Tax=Ensete ventricosum TaxID=4639 RepID=A0A427A0Q2_ENSVE|nr:hypothetical protein B296_00034920 [Ensete ventricosum]